MAMMRLLAREGIGLAVLPPIVVRDELESGDLRQVARLPGLRETFYAITLPRQFVNPMVAGLIDAAASADAVATPPPAVRRPAARGSRGTAR